MATSNSSAAAPDGAGSASGPRTEDSDPPCGVEAIELLNCVTAKPYDQSQCVALLAKLRKCAQSKNVQQFTLERTSDQNPPPRSGTRPKEL